MSPPTIIDVANACRVSPSTVSLVLSDSPRIPHSTKTKVRRKIRELGYRPNHAARSLARGSTGILAVLVPPVDKVFSDPFYSQALEGIYSVAGNSGYRIILEVGTQRFWQSGECEKLLADSPAAGVIFLGGINPEHKILAESFGAGRCAIVGEMPGAGGGSSACYVSGDNFKGGYLAACHLISLGHRKIGHIHGDGKVVSVSERMRGYQKALEEAGIPPDLGIISAGHFSEWYAYLAAGEMLSAPERPTAIFAGNDVMALGVLRAAFEAGLKVPRDFSVVGMDDIPAAAETSPPLTTVKYPVFSMGSHAAAALIKAIEKNSARIEDKFFDVALIERKSSAPPPQKPSVGARRKNEV